ncbi:chaperone Clpb, putative [Entamoeba invadens IP1]|uniref:Chaperone Clpb, putative n=2 Tax=Entamoeba invadens IP1 TaxID=370355 RepID=A0A0A1TVQ9_ENTIV|nr:chaperone Clpb, putative [Entamoeba invadens IP1]ELP84552.1 chaperone Clpb, putative [Entamoeba invadens IP1]|eukprot:XP_004183898.1 chaperone Clpb, putative [Entamoeba invadens IP1]
MDPNTWTDATVKMFKDAQQIAFQRKAPYIVPMHMVQAILDDEQNIVVRVVQMCGGDVMRMKNAVNEEIGKVPVQDPAPVEVGLHPSSQQVLRRAMEKQKVMGDTYLALDTVILSLVEEKEV